MLKSAMGRLSAASALFFAGATAAAAQPANWQLGFEESSGPVMDRIVWFHNAMLLPIITIITLFVLGLLIYVVYKYRADANPNPAKFTHNTAVEIAWTAIPVAILLVISVPSFALLYYMDKPRDPALTLQVTGYQWYWGYAYPDQQIDEYLSFMVPEEDLTGDQIRLLSVDNPVVLPVGVDVEVLITAGDVLHAWAVPSQGVKRDAVPGRMNDTWVHFYEPGVYYGQCSEICGTDHGFMPIEIHAVTPEEFDAWVLEQTAGLDLEEPPVLLTMTWEEAQARRQLALAD